MIQQKSRSWRSETLAYSTCGDCIAYSEIYPALEIETEAGSPTISAQRR
jgi:hypothetical protein